MTKTINNEIWISPFHSNNGSMKKINSESGSFLVNEYGIVQCFEPADDNPFIDEEIEIENSYIYTTQKSIRTFIMPEGVKGFCGDFMRYTRVLDRFELPEGLLSIGNNSFDYDSECNCVFANCILPSVVIPESLTEIGIFSFGHSHIDSLQLPKSLRSPYGRQFKDSSIGTLLLPDEWKDGVAVGKDGNLQLNGLWLDEKKYGYLRWPSTYVEHLAFY